MVQRLSLLRRLLASIAKTLLDILPLALLLAGTQFLVLGKGFEEPGRLTAGLLLTLAGLFLFLRGLELALFPLGEELADGFARRGSLVWLLAFAFCMGFGATVAEPTLLATAAKAEIASGGLLEATPFRLTVALAVGLALVLGVLRLLSGHPLHWYVIAGYLAAVGLTAVSPPEVVGLAYDAGGITTSSVTVPLIAALGGGLASQIRGRDPLTGGFGMIAFASLLPILFVTLYGLMRLSAMPESVMGAALPRLPVDPADGVAQQILQGLVTTVSDLLPITLVVLLFQFAVLRRSFSGGKRLAWGVVWAVLGLYFFIEGLDLAIFPLGEGLARDLVREAGHGWLLVFSLLLGFSTTIAEPALIAITMKAEDLSTGAVRALPLRITVALGVAMGIAVGVYRILTGHPLSLYLVVGYGLVVALTPIVPRYILPLAYDSGGVTTSTVTVPLIVALGLALAQEIPGRHPLVDGFGLIAFASLFPILTVMGYGILGRLVVARRRRKDR